MMVQSLWGGIMGFKMITENELQLAQLPGIQLIKNGENLEMDRWINSIDF